MPAHNVVSEDESEQRRLVAVRIERRLDEADLVRVVERAFAGTLAEAKMALFHPLGFMLASPVDTPEEAVARFTAAPPKDAEN